MQNSLLSLHRGVCVCVCVCVCEREREEEGEGGREKERETYTYFGLFQRPETPFLQRYFILVNKILVLLKAHKNSHHFKLDYRLGVFF